MNISISLNKFDNDWIYIDLYSDNKSITLIASNIYDSPYYLIQSINNLLKLSQNEEIFWEAEIDSFKLLLTKVSSEDVNLEIEYDNKDDFLAFDKDKNKENEIIFCTKCNLKNLAIEIHNLFNKIKNDYSLDKYQQIWNHHFPLDEYNKLSIFLIEIN